MASSAFSFDKPRPKGPLELSDEASTTTVMGLKARGNAYFKDAQYATAVKLYTAALQLAEDDSAFEGEVPTLLSNRSAAHLGVKKVKEAVADAERATQLAPKWPKGWFRLGNACSSAGDLPGTVEAYSRSLALEEPGADVRQTRSRCVETIFKLFLGMAVRRQLKPGEQPGLEDLEAITHPMAYPTLLACLACPDHAVQTAAASQLGMLATSPDHKRDMIAPHGALWRCIGILTAKQHVSYAGPCPALNDALVRTIQTNYNADSLHTGAILCVANLLCAASKDLSQQILAHEKVVDAVVAAARVRPRNRVAWRKHATAAAKALELLAVHATGDTASALASTEAMEVMVALCALPPPPPPPCAMGEFAADPDALEADQEQMMIYVEEMLVAGSALTGLAALCGKADVGESVMEQLEAGEFITTMGDFMHGCAFDQVLTPIFRIITLLAAPSRRRIQAESSGGGGGGQRAGESREAEEGASVEEAGCAVVDVYEQLSRRDELLTSLQTLSSLRPRDLATEAELLARRTEAIGPTVRAEAKALLRKLRDKAAQSPTAAAE